MTVSGSSRYSGCLSLSIKPSKPRRPAGRQQLMMRADGASGERWPLARQPQCRFSSSPPPLPPLPPLSRPPLLCTSVGMYPPLNRSGQAAAGSLTAQRGSSINQRHFQCPITETALLGLSGADSSPIHLLGRGGGERRKVVGWREGAGGREKAIVARRSPFTCSNGGAVKSAGRKTPPKLFSLGQENNKKR